MPKWIAFLLLCIITGQTLHPAFAGNCCAADADMSCEGSTELDSQHDCCTAPAFSSEQPTEDPSHECPDDCQCFCCTHVFFDLPHFTNFQTHEMLLPALSTSYPVYFFQISIPVFQPPQLG